MRPMLRLYEALLENGVAASWPFRRPGDCLRSHFCVMENGAAEGIRTPDPRITNAVLYQLSYRGAPGGRT